MAFHPITRSLLRDGNAEIKLWDMTTRKHIGDFRGEKAKFIRWRFHPMGHSSLRYQAVRKLNSGM